MSDPFDEVNRINRAVGEVNRITDAAVDAMTRVNDLVERAMPSAAALAAMEDIVRETAVEAAACLPRVEAAVERSLREYDAAVRQVDAVSAAMRHMDAINAATRHLDAVSAVTRNLGYRW